MLGFTGRGICQVELKYAFAAALRDLRFSRKLTQEDFSGISSRTYLSTLERGMKSPTLEKIDAISTVLGVHPLTLLTKSYLNKEPNLSVRELLGRVESELATLLHLEKDVGQE